MGLIVQKYGGTSLADFEQIKHVADRIIATCKEGHHVVVVVSAMSGETDRLIALAKHFGRYPNSREYAVLTSTGEQVSIALLAMALMSKGQPACSYTGSQVGIRTSGKHHMARIVDVSCHHIHDDLSAGRVVVVAGFQGINELGEITTLGRGGSDTTAVALAAALQAEECQIYTDVEGVYTADPRIVPQAKLLKEITLNEMLELADLGAKVLQNRAVEFAGKFHVPVRVLSTFCDGSGTLIRYDETENNQATITGITYNRHEAKINFRGIPHKPSLVSEIISEIGTADVDVDMMTQTVNQEKTIDLSFTIPRDEYIRVMEIGNDIVSKLNAREINGDNKVSKVSIVGVGLRSYPNAVSSIFKILGDKKIDIHMISTSEIKLSILIDETYLEDALRTLHSAFGLDRQEPEEQLSKDN